MQDLGEIKSFSMNKKIILALDERWLDYFNSKNPSFKATIQNEKLILVGPKVNRSGPTSIPTSNEVDIIG